VLLTVFIRFPFESTRMTLDTVRSVPPERRGIPAANIFLFYLLIKFRVLCLRSRNLTKALGTLPGASIILVISAFTC